MVTSAYVFIASRQPKKVLRAVRRIDGVIHADALYGTPDVVAIVAGADIAAMDAVIDRIADVPDVICNRLQGCPLVGRNRPSTPRLTVPRERSLTSFLARRCAVQRRSGSRRRQ